MSTITFATELNSRANAKGLYEIRIRMTQNRKHRRFNVGYAIEKKHWNESKKNVKSSHQLHAIINAAISKKIIELEKEYLYATVLDTPISIDDLQIRQKHNVSSHDFLHFFKERIEIYQNGSTKRTLERVLRKLKAFAPKGLNFQDLNHEFMEKYELYLRNTLNNSDNTVHHNLRTIKAIFRQAIRNERYNAIGKSSYAMLNYPLKKQKTQRNKLSLDEIKLIEDLECKPWSSVWHAKNFFLLCYYMLGVRASSMIKMKWENIEANRCNYQAAKNGKQLSVAIPAKGMLILRQYRTKRTTEYIFPYLGKNEQIDIGNTEHAKRIECIISLINNNLATIKKTLGIDKRITTHVARHSFAYNARKASNNDIYAVQKALGHSSVAVTELYFATEENNEADNLSKLMFE